MTVADAIANWLAEKEIRHAFGLIGAGNLALWDAISRLGKTQIVACHHEQAAAMSGASYFRVSGRIAVALVTTGAGSTNAITGVLAAYMDSVPLLVISGNEPITSIKAYHDAHKGPADGPRVIGVQGYDSVKSLSGHFVKHADRLYDHSEGWKLGWALELALKPRMGPVWIDLPRDVAVSEVA
jgi:acetolactate synthase I/II/III large subunit